MRTYGVSNAAPWASAPAVGPAGDIYFNTATKLLYVSDGAAWIAVSAPATFVNTTSTSLGANSTATFTNVAFPMQTLRAGALYRIRANGAFQRTAGQLVFGIYLQVGGNQLAVAGESTITGGMFTLDVQLIADGVGGVTTTGQIVTASRTASVPGGVTGGTVYTVFNQYGSYTPMPSNSFSIGGAFATANAGHFLFLTGASMEVL